MPAHLVKKIATVLGISLEVVAIVALFGWFQAGDPECIYTTDVFAQLRMCSPEIVGDAHSPSYIYLAVILGILLLGVLLHRYGIRSHGPGSPPTRSETPSSGPVL